MLRTANAVAAFLNKQKFISFRDIPYKSQVVALAATFATLCDVAQSPLVPIQPKVFDIDRLAEDQLRDKPL